MPMRQDCKHFESRTYPNGETVRKCNLDLAPEAPWRCPDDCPKFARRLADVNWSHGTLVTPPTPDEPFDALDRNDGSVAAVLDEAEDFINSIGAQVLADVNADQAKGGTGRLKKIFRRRKPSR
ncbi:MAG: hypothetical protein ACRDZU_13615 [Acidimicrobiales bacterium]